MTAKSTSPQSSDETLLIKYESFSGQPEKTHSHPTSCHATCVLGRSKDFVLEISTVSHFEPRHFGCACISSGPEAMKDDSVYPEYPETGRKRNQPLVSVQIYTWKATRFCSLSHLAQFMYLIQLLLDLLRASMKCAFSPLSSYN